MTRVRTHPDGPKTWIPKTWPVIVSRNCHRFEQCELFGENFVIHNITGRRSNVHSKVRSMFYNEFKVKGRKEGDWLLVEYLARLDSLLRVEVATPDETWTSEEIEILIRDCNDDKKAAAVSDVDYERVKNKLLEDRWFKTYYLAIVKWYKPYAPHDDWAGTTVRLEDRIYGTGRFFDETRIDECIAICRLSGSAVPYWFDSSIQRGRKSSGLPTDQLRFRAFPIRAKLYM